MNSKEMLSSVLKTTQMGQVGIRSALDTGMHPQLRQALEQQLSEYDSIETEAHRLASSRGWELPELDSALRGMANMMTRMRLTGQNVDSKLAGMMIQGNTRGMITGLKNLHKLEPGDASVRALSQKLLDTEDANIRQMKDYL